MYTVYKVYGCSCGVNFSCKELRKPSSGPLRYLDIYKVQ